MQDLDKVMVALGKTYDSEEGRRQSINKLFDASTNAEEEAPQH